MTSAPDLRGCVFPLRTEVAQGEYDLLGRILLQAGRLTLDAHRVLSSYTLQVDSISKAALAGKPVRGSWLTQLDRIRVKLKLAELGSAISDALRAELVPLLGVHARASD